MSQSDSAVPPVVTRNVPAAHGEQTLSPAPEYVPGSHGVQSPAAVPPVVARYVPAAQGVQAEAPVDEYVPAEHVSQSLSAVAPVVARNLPAGQLVQVLPDLYWPVGHASMKHAVAPAREVSPGGHVVHTETPVVAEKVPAVQGGQFTFPGPNLPAGHCAQEAEVADIP